MIIKYSISIWDSIPYKIVIVALLKPLPVEEKAASLFIPLINRIKLPILVPQIHAVILLEIPY